MSGELAPGDSLPGERKLSEVLQANRGGVREALKRLVQAGLVTTQHGGSTRVLDYRKTGTLDLIRQMMDSQGELRKPALRSTLELRKILVPEAARLAALRGTPELVDRLRKHLEHTRAAVDTPLRFRSLLFEFWEIVAEGSGNIALLLALNTVREVFEQTSHGIASFPIVSLRDIDDLEAVTFAIEARDGERAREIALRRYEAVELMIRKQAREVRPESA